MNRDTLLKWLTNLYCFLFWWNPAVYLLQKDLDRILEIKCDLAVTSLMSHTEKADYLNTILSAFRKDKKEALIGGAVAFLGRKNSLMEERFEAVSKSNDYAKVRTLFQIVFSIAVISLFCFSYLFVAQSSFEAPITEIATSNEVVMVEPEDIV